MKIDKEKTKKVFKENWKFYLLVIILIGIISLIFRISIVSFLIGISIGLPYMFIGHYMETN